MTKQSFVYVVFPAKKISLESLQFVREYSLVKMELAGVFLH